MIQAYPHQTEEPKHAGKPLIKGFIPQFKGKKVTIRLVSGGQPLTDNIEGYNPYEIIIQTAKGQLLVQARYCHNRARRHA